MGAEPITGEVVGQRGIEAERRRVMAILDHPAATLSPATARELIATGMDMAAALGVLDTIQAPAGAPAAAAYDGQRN